MHLLLIFTLISEWQSSQQRSHQTGWQAVTLWTCIRKMPGSNRNRVSDYSQWDVSWLFAVPPGKFRVTTLVTMNTSFWIFPVHPTGINFSLDVTYAVTTDSPISFVCCNEDTNRSAATLWARGPHQEQKMSVGHITHNIYNSYLCMMIILWRQWCQYWEVKFSFHVILKKIK